MKKLLCGCLVVLAGFLPSPASGQAVVQPNWIFQNPLVLVENKDVQKELKLSDDQVKSLAVLSRQYTEGLKGLGFQDLEKRKKVVESTQKGLSEVLQDVQTRRLKQLEWQQRGASAFLDPQLAKDLSLTTEQQGAIAKSLQGIGPKWIAVIQGAKGNQPEIQKRLDELNRGVVADIVKGLTAEQQAKWGELTGTPFAGVFPISPFIGMVLNPRPQPVLQWHMNDLAAAQAEARKTGKPIFVTFRCEA